MDKFWQMNNWKNQLPKFLGDDFFSEFPGLLNNNSTTGPQANIYESGNELMCVFALPGLKLEDVDIYTFQKTLEVRGMTHVDYKGFRLIQEELSQGPFKRTIELPYPVRDDKVSASYKNGLLIIHLHRKITSNQIKNKVNIKNLDEE